MKNDKIAEYLTNVSSLLMNNCSGLIYSTNEKDLYDVLTRLSEIFNVLLYDGVDFFQDLSANHIQIQTPEIFRLESTLNDALGVVSMYSMLEDSEKSHLNDCLSKSSLPFVFLDYGVCIKDGDLWKVNPHSVYSQHDKIQFVSNLDTLRVQKRIRALFVD